LQKLVMSKLIRIFNNSKEKHTVQATDRLRRHLIQKRTFSTTAGMCYVAVPTLASAQVSNQCPVETGGE